jgi:hypothetical protein
VARLVHGRRVTAAELGPELAARLLAAGVVVAD